MDAHVTTSSRHPDEIRFHPHELVGARMDPAAIARLSEMARTMLAACDGPVEERPFVTELDCLDEPGNSFATISHAGRTIGLICPLPTPEGHEASCLLRLILRACGAMSEVPLRSTHDAEIFVTAIFVLSKIGSLAIGSGTIHGGTGSIVQGPSPFGPAFILDVTRGRKRRVEFDAGIPVSWTADIHSVDEAMTSITLHGVSYEPDPGEIEDPITTMREIARTGIGPALEILRKS